MGSRAPIDFTRPRAALTHLVRAVTTSAHAGEVGLHLRAAMLDRFEQLRIEARNPRQNVRVSTVVLAIVLVYLTNLASVGNEDLVPEGRHQTTDPARVCPASRATRAGVTLAKYAADRRLRRANLAPARISPSASSTQNALARSPRSKPTIRSGARRLVGSEGRAMPGRCGLWEPVSVRLLFRWSLL